MVAPKASDPVVLITGAAGGLGQGLVSEFATQSWRVVAAHHRPGPLAEHEKDWNLQLDVTKAEEAGRAVEQVLARWGRLDLLINNAGVTADQLSWTLTDEEWDRVIDVNLKGAFICSRAAVRTMMKQRDGQIINISSFAARNGHPGQANYVAAKAGLIGLTESLAKELGSRNVRVNAVLPGVLPTPMTARLTQQQMDALALANALGRINSVAEVARFVAFLATMQNVSGQVFQLDSRIGRWT